MSVRMAKGGIKRASRGTNKARGNAGKSNVKLPLKKSIKKAFGKPGTRQPRWQGAGGAGATGKNTGN